ncbi:polysaccharide biosynthesis/export family protein [Flavisolibacter tropicus]|uniref:polysaccharide biosynthesis/export family protein n=1 Tax=Flavisolibacter tropicus TaxID=1492898 RepID=UPI00082BD4E4|nr:polysaccharide biosynthesis/export family protein [Flavisolibacter tropicus]
MRFSSLAIILFSLFFISCGTQRAVYNYLEDVNDSTFRKSVYIAEPSIQKNDLLSIQVYSAALDPQIDALYNMQGVQGGGGSAQGGQLGGYLVDVHGNIELPRIGSVKAEGLKKGELEAAIKERLKTQLTNPNVIVRFLNFRITMLGEVGNPGVLNIPTERLTVLEAIGMAGGVTQFGTIKQVRILREVNGERQLGILDLTSKEIFASPYYQLQQNDVVVVNQTRYKLRQTEQQRVIQQVGFFTGIISAAALIIAIFNR